MATIADRMRAMGMSAGQASDMLRQMGVRSREMSLLMIQGGDSIRNAREEVTSLGLSISAIDAAKVEIANDAFSRIGMVIEGISSQMAISFAPILLGIAEHFQGIAKEAGGMGTAVDRAFQLIQSGAGHVLNAVAGIKVGWLEMSKLFQTVAAGIGRNFLSFAQYLTEIYNKIPFLDPIQFGADIEGFLLSMESAISETQSKIDAVLNRPLPSVALAQTIDNVRERMNKLATESVAAGKRVGEALQEIVIAPRDKLVAEAEQGFSVLEEFGIQAARNIQDSFANFLFDPFKDGLKGMLRGFVDMLRQMVAQLLARQILLSLFGGFAGKGGIMGGIAGGLIGKQKGGPVNRNTPYMVGERGPEMMVPNTSGTIVPNHKLGGGQSTNVTVNINAEDPGAEGRIRTMIERDMAPQIVQAAVGRTVGLFNRPSFA